MADVLVVVEGMDDIAGRHEEQRFEERMRHEVKHARGVSADPNGQEHVPDLAHRGVGEDPLDVNLGGPDGGGKECRHPADDGHRGCRRRGPVIQLVHPGDEVDARGDHGGSVDQR